MKDRRKVFISYGRNDALAFAKKLSQCLNAEGFDTWLDIENGIDPGDNFDLKIETGIKDSDVLLALLSQWSTRDSSFCRNEILFAQAHDLPVLPVRIADVHPPIQIFSVQYVDIEAEGEGALDQVVEYLSFLEEKGHLPPAPESVVERNIRRWLKGTPEDITGDLAEHGGVFFGREWLFDRIRDWLAEEDTQLMLLAAPPGFGKSAVCTRLSIHFEVLGFHFCRSTRPRSCEGTSWVLGLARQLAGQLEPYRREISALAAPNLGDARSLFRDLIADPLGRCESYLELEGPRLFVIDGLDEAVAVNGPELVDVIIEAIPHLPDWLRVLVTSRPDRSLLTQFHTVGTSFLELGATDPENLQDVYGFITKKLENKEKQGGSDYCPEVIRKLAGESDGNFLFAKLTLDALAESNPAYRLTENEIGNLPGKLHGLYHLMFRKRFDDLDDYETQLGPIIDCLSAAKGPLTAVILSKACSFSTRGVRRVLRALSQFLTESPKGFVFFHKSLNEWLADEQASAEFAADIEQGRRLLFEYCKQQYEDGVATMSDYSLRFWLHHIQENLMPMDLGKPLTDAVFLERFVREFGSEGLIHSLSRLPNQELESNGAQSALNGDKDIQEAVLGLIRALQLSSRALEMAPDQFYAQLYARLAPTDNTFLETLREELRDRIPGSLYPLFSPLAQHDSSLLYSFRPGMNDLCWAHFLPDGNQFLTLGCDGHLEIWEVVTGKKKADAKIPLEGKILGEPMLSRDGTRLALNCGFVVLVWNVVESDLAGKLFYPLPSSSDSKMGSTTPPSRSQAYPGYRSMLAVGLTSGNIAGIHRPNMIWWSEDLSSAVACVQMGPFSDHLGPFESQLCFWSLNEENPGLGYSVESIAAPETTFLAIDDNGKYAFVGKGPRGVEVRNIQTGEVLCAAELKHHHQWLDFILMDGSGALMIGNNGSQTLLPFDGSGIRELGSLPGKCYAGRTVDRLFYLKEILKGEADRGAFLRIRRNIDDQGETRIPSFPGRPIISLSNNQILSLTENYLVATEMASGGELLRLSTSGAAITCASVSSDESLVLIASADNIVRLWRISPCTEQGHDQSTMEAETTLAGVSIGMGVVHSLGDRMEIQDTSQPATVETVSGYEGHMRAFSTSSDGKYLASGGDQGDIIVWDTTNWSRVGVLSERGPWVEQLFFLAGNKHLGAVLEGGTVQVRSLQNYSIVVEHNVPVRSRAARGPGDQLALSNERHQVLTLKSPDYCIPHHCATHEMPVIRLDFTADGRYLVSGGLDEKIQVWDMAKGRNHSCLAWAPEIPIPLELFPPQIQREGFVFRRRLQNQFGGPKGPSPDDNFFVLIKNENWLVVPSKNHDLVVWSLETGSLIHCLSGHTENISAIIQLGYSDRVLTASYDRFLRIWDIRAGCELGYFMLDEPLAGAEVAHCGKRVVVIDTIGQRHIFAIP